MGPRMMALTLQALVLPMLAACVAPLESTVALSEPGEPYDSRLVGTWSNAGMTDVTGIMVAIRPQEQSPQLDITAVMTASDQKLKFPVYWLQATAFASRIGPDIYYNLRRRRGAGLDYTADGERPGFMILKVHFLNDAAAEFCLLWNGRNDRFQLEKDGHEVRATFPDAKDGGRYLLLDAPRERLVELIRELPSEAFPCLPAFEKATAIDDHS